jgi:hypothetical protein
VPARLHQLLRHGRLAYLTEDDLKRVAAFGFLSGTPWNNTIVDEEGAPIWAGSSLRSVFLQLIEKRFLADA